MKQQFILVLLVIFTSKSFSQDSDFSIEASYPLLIDDNYHGRDFNGIVDIGAKYRFAEIKGIRIGAAVNGGLLTNSSNQDQDLSDFKVTSYLLQPKIFAELDISELPNFHPFAGVGYSFIFSEISGTITDIDASTSNTRSGFNINLGAYYDLTNKIFFQGQYDFIRFSDHEEMSADPFISDVNISKVGLGLWIN